MENCHLGAPGSRSEWKDSIHFHNFAFSFLEIALKFETYKRGWKGIFGNSILATLCQENPSSLPSPFRLELQVSEDNPVYSQCQGIQHQISNQKTPLHWILEDNSQQTVKTCHGTDIHFLHFERKFQSSYSVEFTYIDVLGWGGELILVHQGHKIHTFPCVFCTSHLCMKSSTKS